MSADRAGRHPDLRPSNAEREPYERALAQAVAEGRLDQQTFEDRLAAVAEAKSSAALDATVADIPFTLHTERAARARNASRRRFVLGLAGLGVLGGASAWATRQLPDPPPEPADAAEPEPSATAPETSGSIATTMVQVPMMTAEMFPTLVAHLESIGVTEVGTIHAWDVYLTVQGIKKGKNIMIDYQTDEAPQIGKGSELERTFDVKKLRDTDAADLLKRSAKIIEVGDDPDIRVETSEDAWLIIVTGVDSESVGWDLSGKHRRRL